MARPGPYDYFVIFAEMRTGSNFLELNLRQFPDINTFGEAFNPDFIGYPDWPDMFGMTMPMREADPLRLIRDMSDRAKKLPGFRYFFDHDPRVLEEIISNPRCAKIILTRNALDSYVSIKLATATDMWKMTDMTHARPAKVPFNQADFERHLDNLQGFQLKILRGLQKAGQTAFYLTNDDINDLDVINGIARFLGSAHQLEELNRHLKPQHPIPMTEKVSNPEEMVQSLRGMDRWNLDRTPHFEPRRTPAVPTYHAAAKSPLLFLPIKGGPTARVLDWMAALDGVSKDRLVTGFTQKTLRDWKDGAGVHRSFSVLRHPLERAHFTFCEKILKTGPGTFGDIRRRLKKKYRIPIPDDPNDPGYGRKEHYNAFRDFLEFLRGNLSGQTDFRMDPFWGTQSSILTGMAAVSVPGRLIHEDQLERGLSEISAELGLTAPPLPEKPAQWPFDLEVLYDGALENLARRTYKHDYQNFGFTNWR
ncbi:MAG: nodulation protein NodH [Brevirhabdus sp.]